MITDYARAKKLGEKEYRRAVARGQYPYLPSLEEMVRDVDRYPEIPLGVREIPLDMIAGTRTSGRQNAFAANFMPLMKEDTEFASKWSSLYDSQVREGLRDPVKAYEFMNLFYVEEGNKRVSVMRFLGAVTIPANVIRIRPPRTDSVQSRVYYEYLDFFRVTGMFEITFSEPGRYAKLAAILEQNLRDPWPEDLLEKLRSGFTAFKSVYRAKGGFKMSLTAGDALLIYLGIYSLDSLLREGDDEIGRRLLRLWREFVSADRANGIALIEKREEVGAPDKKPALTKAARLMEKTGAAGIAGAADLAGAFAGITVGAGAAQMTRNVVRSGLSTVLHSPGYSAENPLRIAFIHEKDADSSGWVYGHELGRNHLQESFGSLVETMHFENCREEGEILDAFSTVRAENCGLVFVTSENLSRYALRFAIENPRIRVLTCCFNRTDHAMRSYYGKMFEAKYIMGALAASLTDDHRIGYLAGKRDPAALCSLNAFALGAQLTDPSCRVDLRWFDPDTERGNGPDRDMSSRIHLVSDLDMIRPADEDRRYGLYLREDGGGYRRLAASIWNWGSFYELVARRVLDGTYDNTTSDQKDRALNYWFGLSSGIIDIIYSKDLPAPSRKLAAILQREIGNGGIHPFEGAVRDRNGRVHGTDGGVLSREEIMTMDWICENVDGD
ncbi:MAG: BMP family ABC transporter substrate-binding protein [Lachnospiraceae bacterium]|nr:BMP family ABC transporter substrate-binding protein [Lachnospiraceae bacterium]